VKKFHRVDEQTVEFHDFHFGEPLTAGFDQFPSLFQGEHRGFRGVDGHGDDHAVKKLPRAADQVEVSVGEGIERSRIQYGFHGVSY